MAGEEIEISGNTQKFIMDISNLSQEKYQKTIDFIEKLTDQQNAEAELESKRGWRYMWQRTPKPYLLLLGYFVFFGAVGSFGYNAYSYAGNHQIMFLMILAAIMILPLIPVSYLSYCYVKKIDIQEDKPKDVIIKQDTIN